MWQPAIAARSAKAVYASVINARYNIFRQTQIDRRAYCREKNISKFAEMTADGNDDSRESAAR